MPICWRASRPPSLPQQPEAPGAAWQDSVLEAITICTSQVRANGFAPELRLRMSSQARQTAPFHALAADADALQASQHADSAGREAALQQFRARLEACRGAVASVYAHLDEHGISVGLVFRIRQVRERILRIRALIDCLQEPAPGVAAARLLAQMAALRQDRRSLRALIASNSSMLAAKVTERSSEVGEHYITRDRAAYRTMLRQAAGGGALTGLTTLMKFGVMALGLSAFWNGFWSGVVYAGSFVLIQLLHWTLATKQPAMTAPAMAAKLKDLGLHRTRWTGFVDEVTHLVRSQAAAVLGNVGIVVPVVVLLCLLLQAAHRLGRCWTRRGHHLRAAFADTGRPERAVRGHHRRAAVRIQHHRRLGGELVRVQPAGLRAALQPGLHAPPGVRRAPTAGPASCARTSPASRPTSRWASCSGWCRPSPASWGSVWSCGTSRCRPGNWPPPGPRSAGACCASRRCGGAWPAFR
jgi:hypothetical protein